MRTNGQLRKCDRCGATVFLKIKGDKETDGGFSRWSTFEEAKGWSTETSLGDLCPECTGILDEIKAEYAAKRDQFMKGAKE